MEDNTLEIFKKHSIIPSLMGCTNIQQNGVLRVDCRGCINNYTLSNPNCLKNVLSFLKEEKGIKQVILAGDFTKKISKKDIALLYDYLLKIKEIKFAKVCKKCRKKLEDIAIKLFEDPVNAYLLVQEIKCRCGSTTYSNLITKMLQRTNLIKKAVQEIKKSKIKTSREIYSRIFQTSASASFIGVDVLPFYPIGKELLESYRIDGTLIKIYKGKHYEKIYVIKPPEMSLHADQVQLLTKAFEILSEEEEIENLIEDPIEARKNAHKLGKQILKKLNSDLTDADLNFLTDILVRYTIGFGIIELFFKDHNLQDIYIDSPGDKPVHVFHGDHEECTTNIIIGHNDLEKISTRLRAMSGRPFDEAFPVLHCELDDFGIRVCGIKQPLTFAGTGFAFRKHRSRPWTLPQFIAKGMMDAETAGFLSFLVDGQVSILVTGPRGSGKTSLMSSLITEVPLNLRVIVMEDTPEVPIRQFRNAGYKIQHIKTSAELSESQRYEMSAEYALRTALRLGESVLVIGEVRGKEAKSLFEAMRIGAAGNVVLGTIHGSSAYDTWDRIVNDIGVPSTSFKAADIIVSCASLRKGDSLTRNRRLVGITEVRKNWTNDPAKERGFFDLVKYNYRTDSFRRGNLGRSEIIKRIAKQKGMSVSQALTNLRLRGKIKKMYVDVAKSFKKPELLELEHVINGNNKYYELAEKFKGDKLLKKFKKWLIDEAKKIR